MESKSLSELRRLCRERSFPTSGGKYYLIKRLERNYGEPPASEYGSLTLEQLKQLCGKRGRPTNGIKNDLIWELIETHSKVAPIPSLIKFGRVLSQMLTQVKSPSYAPRVESVRYFEVKNAVQTSSDKVEISWIAFWSTHTGMAINQCCIHGCASKATVGGHLIYKYNKRRHYIVPICSFHNSSSFNNQYSFLKEGTLVVSITKKKHRT